MNAITFARILFARIGLFLAATLSVIHLACAQNILWEAFNDHRPTAGVTSDNATGWDMLINGDGGVLKNIATGADLPVVLEVVVEGNGIPDNFGALTPPNTNSPAYLFFQGKVDLTNGGLPGVRASLETRLILKFNNLDPVKRYNFRGTVSRGGGYNDRWSFFSIESADAYVNAHVDGSNNKNLFTKATFPAGTLETNQVALNSGDNKAGSMVGWDNIEPGADGTFQIAAQQYTNAAPFGNPAAAAATLYGYGLYAIYLAEVAATGNLRITENPANQTVPAGTTATFKVVANSPQAITYQWQRSAPGATNFANVSGATSASYTTAALAVADDNAQFRCVVTSGGNSITSPAALLRVDGSIPTISGIRGSINFNSVYVTFSEAMKLDQLGTALNFKLTGGLSITSAIALDASNVRLLTSSTQALATRYTLTVTNVQDLAGNAVAANAGGSFTSFSIKTNAVGAEIWKNITGSPVQNLRNDPRYPSQPDLDFAIATFDSFQAVPATPDINTYGGRMRAWLTPEENAQYEFFLRSDDQGEFRISLDDKFDTLDDPNILADAADTSIGDPFQEPGIDSSVSAPIQLERGRRYAVQVLWKEGNGSDYGQLAWRKVGDPTPAADLQPIPSRFLSYYGPAPSTAPEPKITSISLQTGRVVIEWTGLTLQSSDDLKTWVDEVGASNPFSVTPTVLRFYRSRN